MATDNPVIIAFTDSFLICPRDVTWLRKNSGARYAERGRGRAGLDLPGRDGRFLRMLSSASSNESTTV